MVKFSLVCPIKSEVGLIPFTLPSFYRIDPDEVILCLDKPAPQNVVSVIRRVAKACNAEDKTRIVSNFVADHPIVQFEIGRYNAVKRGRSFLGALIHTVMYAHPHYLKGFIYERKREKTKHETWISKT